MRKVIVSAFVSVDGVMQAPGGPEEDTTGGFEHGGWTVNYWDDATMQVMGKFLDQPFDLLLGRKTYDIFAAYWPYIDPASSPIARKFSQVTKYVATSSKPALTWQKSVALRGDVAAEVARLKQQDGPPLLIQGSSVLLQTLLANDLINEAMLLVFPLVLGKGKKLFRDGARARALKLTGSEVATTGVVINSYVRDGAIKTGSFGLEDPSEAEIARREKMKKGDF